MKGVILAGGGGTRLAPLTNNIPKVLLPVYDKPMIFYPIQTLIDSGIKDILIVCGKNGSEMFKEMINDSFDVNIKYTERESKGTADAILAAEEFVGKESFTVIYGDNIFTESFKEEVESFEDGAELFIVKVDDPKRYGVAEIVDGKIIGIEEKPENPKSNYADTGLIIFDNTVFEKAKSIEIDKCGEYLIPEVLNLYINEGKLRPRHVNTPWFDAGTFESLLEVGNFMRDTR